MAHVERLTVGVPGVDEILHGGLISGRTYLVRGEPGSGKTILGLHFLQAGLDAGEAVMMVSLSEPEEGLRANAALMGFSIESMPILDLTPSSSFFSEGQVYDIFSPAEVEREPVTTGIVEMVEKVQPRRIYIDAITQLRYLTSDALEFRRHLFSLLRFLTEQEATVIVSSDYGAEDFDMYLQFMSDGIVELTRGGGDRTITVHKYRGSGFQGGAHAMRITEDGIHVFPRLVPDVHSRQFTPESMPTGIADLDAVLHGGLEQGTITIVTGPVGSGKTTLGLSFLRESARNGTRSVAYLFEESLETVMHRSRAVGIPLEDLVAEGMLKLLPIEPLLRSADEFANMVRRDVEEWGARVVMLDSTAGYLLSLRGSDPVSRLHALTRYLRNMGATGFIISETDWLDQVTRVTAVDISYMSDNVILLRYLEREGSLRKVISVLKKRVSGFDSTLREMMIDKNGIRLGPPLTDLAGEIGQPRRL